MTSSVSSGGTEDAHLVALQRRYAQLAVDDPEPPRMRDEVISGYLPVVDHLARRFRRPGCARRSPGPGCRDRPDQRGGSIPT
jgi:hypothetical protein